MTSGCQTTRCVSCKRLKEITLLNQLVAACSANVFASRPCCRAFDASSRGAARVLDGMIVERDFV